MKSAAKRNLFLFGVPGKVGGAATKISALLRLLREDYRITVVLPKVQWMKDRYIRRLAGELGFACILRKSLPARTEGDALAICELDFFTSGTAERVKRAGLRLFWSNEMMWAFKGEREAVRKGWIDKVLFASEFQAREFAELYAGVPQAVTGNYISPDEFRFKERRNAAFTIGRLSRPDPVKFPADFPVFYEELGIGDARFRVMAWDAQLRKIYSWHRFDARWDLLAMEKEGTEKFLHSLDLFVYPLGHRFLESWGRSTVEAMLTGAIPVVPRGHQFHKLLVSGESGFLCGAFSEYFDCVRELHANYPLRRRMAERCRRHAVEALCRAESHREVWLSALDFEGGA
ncbi:MAG: hypothetical protein M2R45_00879 [Verrucomicrobia subdivision 3 bacterium]|nr:hypothetical protein [Limisphaerales bacterium]MCS1414547.1 hypothetical protein [Limisphaerales bacterium]